MVNLELKFSGTYECTSCNTTFSSPNHCGRLMDFDKSDNTWICWKGDHPPCCGKESKMELDSCCDAIKIVPQIG